MLSFFSYLLKSLFQPWSCLAFVLPIFFYTNRSFAQSEKNDNTTGLLNQLETANEDTVKARIYGLLAWEYKFNNPVLAMDYAEKELASGKKWNSDFLLADGYRVKALILVGEEKITEGMPFYDSCLVYARKMKSLYYEASCYSLMAGMYGDHGDFHKSIELYSLGLDVAQKSKDRSLIATLSNNLAEAYQSTGRNSELAQKYFLLALSNSLQIENWPVAGMNSANLAQDYVRAGKRDFAINELIRSNELLYKDTTNRYQYATNCHILASVYFDLDSLKRAEELALRSHAIMMELERFTNALRPLSTLTNIYVRQKNLTKATQFANLMLAESTRLSAKLYISESYKALSEIKRAEKNYELALTYYEIYKSWNDSLFEIGRENSIALVELKVQSAQKEMEVKYETDKKIDENKNLADKNANLKLTISIVIIASLGFLILIVLLYLANKKKNKINAELQEQKRKVEQQAIEKGTLVHEIHHRVKNNLTMLKSLLYLQAKSSKDPLTQQILSETQARIQSMALVHQNLYEEENNGKLDFAEFMQSLFGELTENFSQTQKEIEFTIEGDCDELNISQAIPLGLIMNELCTNSIKYAFDKIDQPRININLFQKENTLEIIYSDNGPGLPNGFSSSGGGFGFKLLSILTRQLSTELNYSKSEQGFFFSMKIEILF